jgi:hypothetical protein
MSDGEGKSTLSRDDLFLLMEAYKNTIELNTSVLDQQKFTAEQVKELLEKASGTIDAIRSVAIKLDNCAAEFRNVNESWTQLLDQKTGAIKADLSGEHKDLGFKVKVLTITIGTIVIPLIGIIGTLIVKLSGGG